jgi:hypothetical protein
LASLNCGVQKQSAGDFCGTLEPPTVSGSGLSNKTLRTDIDSDVPQIVFYDLVRKPNPTHDLHKRRLPLTRQILLLPLLGIALVGLVQSQSTTKAGEDPAGEVAKQEILNVLKGYDQATKTGNADASAPLYNDDMLLLSERFGRGEVLTKAQVMDLHRSKRLKNISYVHNNIRLRAFGGNTVVMTGHSDTILEYKGKLSKGPRLFTFVFVKLDGKWQIVSQHISDIPKGDAPWN